MEYSEFEEKMVFDKIDPAKAVAAVEETLKRIDVRLMDHGERVAFIANKICEKGEIDLDRKTLFFLCVFHDIGAYETEEIDQMLEFETKIEYVQRHSIYGYLFLKYLTPLSNYAEAVLYHHYTWEKLKQVNSLYGEYAAMIQLADRIDVAGTYEKDLGSIKSILNRSKVIFKESYFDVAMKCLEEDNILQQIKDKTYLTDNALACTKFIHSTEEAFDYLKMIVYSIDFRSDHTVTHTINTVSIAVNIAMHFHMSDKEIEYIYIGALLHDIGKVAIPHAILESPGRLSDSEMAVMRTHVEETAILIKDVIPDEVYRIAIRHHEKLDGKGYPYGLTGDELSLSERIVAVSDIISALSSRRSYKESFPKEKTLNIITDMAGSQLDSDVCQYVLENYDEIMQKTDESRKQVINQYLQIKEEYAGMMRN